MEDLATMAMDLKPLKATRSRLQLFSYQWRNLPGVAKQLLRRWLLGVLFERDSYGRAIINLPDDVVITARSSISVHSGSVHIKSHTDHLILETANVVTEDGSIAAIHEQPHWFNGRPSYPIEVLTDENLPCVYFTRFDEAGQPILPAGWVAHPNTP